MNESRDIAIKAMNSNAIIVLQPCSMPSVAFLMKSSRNLGYSIIYTTENNVLIRMMKMLAFSPNASFPIRLATAAESIKNTT